MGWKPQGAVASLDDYHSCGIVAEAQDHTADAWLQWQQCAKTSVGINQQPSTTAHFTQVLPPLLFFSSVMYTHELVTVPIRFAMPGVVLG